MDNEYISCPFIESGLVLYPRALYHCYIPLKGKISTTHICDFHGGPLPVEKIKRSRNEYREKLADMEKYPELRCNGCPFVQKRRWNANDYLFDMLYFSNSLACNLKCNFCVSRSATRQRLEYSIIEVLSEMLANRYISPISFISWSGGEPVLQPDFEEALELAYMSKSGIVNAVETNSSIFSPLLEQYLKLSGDRFIVKTSVDCGTRETFLKIKGDDLFNDVWINLGRYAKSSNNVVAKYIISHDNLSTLNLDGFVENMKKFNINYAHLDINHNFYRDEIYEKHLETAEYLYSRLFSSGIKVEFGYHILYYCPQFVSTHASTSKLMLVYPQSPQKHTRPLSIVNAAKSFCRRLTMRSKPESMAAKKANKLKNFEKEYYELFEDLEETELKIILDILESAKKSLRKNRGMRS